jgi:hypothetical protein
MTEVDNIPSSMDRHCSATDPEASATERKASYAAQEADEIGEVVPKGHPTDRQIDHGDQSPLPSERRNWTRQNEIVEILHHRYTTILEHDLLVAEYVKLQRNSKVGQLVQPPAGGHQKNDKGIAKAARELVMLGKTEGGRRKIIERALQVANTPVSVRNAAITAGLDKNRSALLELARTQPDSQLAKVSEIAARRKARRQRKSSGQVKAPIETTKEITEPTLYAWSTASQTDRKKFVNGVGARDIVIAFNAIGQGLEILKGACEGTGPAEREAFVRAHQVEINDLADNRECRSV